MSIMSPTANTSAQLDAVVWGPQDLHVAKYPGDVVRSLAVEGSLKPFEHSKLHFSWTTEFMSSGTEPRNVHE